MLYCTLTSKRAEISGGKIQSLYIGDMNSTELFDVLVKAQDVLDVRQLYKSDFRDAQNAESIFNKQ